MALPHAFLVMPSLILSNGAATVPHTFCLSEYFVYTSISLLDREFLGGRDLALLVIFVLSGPSSIPKHRENTQIFVEGIMNNYTVNLKFDIKN